MIHQHGRVREFVAEHFPFGWEWLGWRIRIGVWNWCFHRNIDWREFHEDF
jgi:hypothetical protein